MKYRFVYICATTSMIFIMANAVHGLHPYWLHPKKKATLTLFDDLIKRSSEVSVQPQEIQEISFFSPEILSKSKLLLTVAI